MEYAEALSDDHYATAHNDPDHDHTYQAPNDVSHDASGSGSASGAAFFRLRGDDSGGDS